VVIPTVISFQLLKKLVAQRALVRGKTMDRHGNPQATTIDAINN
jgi:hypothetical protein